MLNPSPISCHAIQVAPELTLFFTGPGLEKGEMPAVFYFALSGEDSLCLDPYNQPVQFLSDKPIRIFSLTLPGHEANLPPQKALEIWAEDLAKGKDILSDFTDQVIESINYVIDKGYAKKDKIAVAGLSRGGFIASHVAAKVPDIRCILQFAPLTKITAAKEFAKIKKNPLLSNSDVVHLVPNLFDRNIRIYIGNRDLRVGTKHCFDFVQKLADCSFDHKITSPLIELFINPSIGHLGHGTPPHIFKQGSDWLCECLLKTI